MLPICGLSRNSQIDLGPGALDTHLSEDRTGSGWVRQVRPALTCHKHAEHELGQRLPLCRHSHFKELWWQNANHVRNRCPHGIHYLQRLLLESLFTSF